MQHRTWSLPKTKTECALIHTYKFAREKGFECFNPRDRASSLPYTLADKR